MIFKYQEGLEIKAGVFQYIPVKIGKIIFLASFPDTCHSLKKLLEKPVFIDFNDM